MLLFFVVVKSAVAPLAPGRGEGPGGRGEDPLVRVCRSSGFSPNAVLPGVLFRGVFLTTEGTEGTEEGLAGH